MSKMYGAAGKESLPKGWIVKESRSQQGKMYFCHPVKKISLWSLPEVYAFERGMRQLEMSDAATKFKPVKADPGKSAAPLLPEGDGIKSSSTDNCMKGSDLQPHEKPFRMTFKAARKLPKSSTGLNDFIAEAASFCSFSNKVTAAKKVPLAGPVLPSKSPAGVTALQAEPDPVSAPGSNRSPSAPECVSLQPTSDSGQQKAAKRKHEDPFQGAEAGSSSKKPSDRSGFGNDAENLKSLPKVTIKEVQSKSEKHAEKTSKKVGSVNEEDIKAKLANVKARIRSRMQSFSRVTPIVIDAPKMPSVEAKVTTSSDDVAGKSTMSATTMYSTSARKAERSPAATASSPSAVLKSRRKKKRDQGQQLAAASAQLVSPTSKQPSASSSERKPPDKPTASPGPAGAKPARPLPLVGRRPSRAALVPRAVTVLPNRVTRSAAKPPADAAPPTAAGEPAGQGRLLPSAEGASPGGEDWASERRPEPPPAGREPAGQGRLLPPAEEASPGSEGRAPERRPEPPSVAAEDDQELMDWDGPELNQEEVLSQIASLRDRIETAADVSGWKRGHAVPHSTWDQDPPAASWDRDPAAHIWDQDSVAPSWDLDQVQPLAGQPAPRPLTIVVDTNVLIHGVGFVLDVRDSLVDGERPVLLIPWVVIQELDKLKQNRQEVGQQADVAQKARAAISFLLDCFQARHPCIKGQTTSEAAAARGQLQSRVADDAILECCLASAGAGGRVLLLSDDKNLLTKVLLHGLQGASRRQLLPRVDLDGTSTDISVTQENLFCISKTVLRKVLSYVIRREMALVYGQVWSAMDGVRRPWWSLRDLLACVYSYLKTVFQPVFADQWSRWQQILRLATRPVLTADEERTVCAGVAALLPLLRPVDHYGPLLRPLAGALRPGAPLPAAPLAALGAGFSLSPGSDPAVRRGPAAPAPAPAGGMSGPTEPPPPPPQPGPEPEYGNGERTVRTPPPPDPDAVMDATRAELEPDPSEVLDLFQNVWSYVNTCCGLLLDAAGMSHCYQYERPAVLPSPAECAAFLPELGTVVQILTHALQRVMEVSVVVLTPDCADLLAVRDCLLALVALAGQEATLSPHQLHRFFKAPANRVLLGKGLDQMADFLRSLEMLQRMVN